MAQSNSASQTPIWARPEPAGRRPRFNRDQIAAAALAIADAEGFEAVSMRKIAAALGAGTMSLYRYIATKADLMALLDDALLGEALVPEGEMPADWRDALALVAGRTRTTLLRHPWAVHALYGPGRAQNEQAGPNGLRHFEQSLAALDGAPLDMAVKVDLIAIVDDYVIGHALQAGEQISRFGGPQPMPASPVGGFMASRLASGDYPHVRALLTGPAAQSLIDPGRLEGRFERGLRLLIDGFAAPPGPSRQSD
jgi:AcrR family transcriptional regulator